ncbi:MAG: alpha/beta hydrolase [Acidimicrobiales bacterium]
MARRRRWLGAMIGALGMVASACGGTSHQAAPTTSRPPGTPTTAPSTAAPSTVPTNRVALAPLNWIPCTGPLSGFQCAVLRVPLNPAKPAGPTIALALDRKQATGSRIGSLLVNPGGPGVSGVDQLPGIYGQLSPALTAHFDVVGFDPPGVGHSDGVTCLSSQKLYAYYHLDPAPTTPAGFTALLNGNKAFNAACEAHSGPILPYVSTVDAAIDMDLIRRALGDPKLNYLGFSYGTFLGATYAQLYPTHIRAMVLDGAIDPTLGVVSELDQQSAALDGELNMFFAQCVASATCAWKPGAHPHQAFNALLAKVRASALAVPGTNQTVGPAELLYGTGDALYDTASWPDLASALAAMDAGDGEPMLNLFNQYFELQSNGTYSDVAAAETAVNCLDDPAPSIPQVQADAPAAEAMAPVFGLLNLYGEIGCDLWPVKPTGAPHAITAAGSPPIVVVGSTGDPITPYPWAQHLASQLAAGVLLTRVGDGHTGYGASVCIQDQLNPYFIDLKPPAAGTRCPSGSNPNPL